MAWKRAKGTTAQAHTMAPIERGRDHLMAVDRDLADLSTNVPEDPAIEVATLSHEEIHRRLHLLHHGKAIADQGQINHCPLKKGKEKVIKTKRRSKNGHNQSKHSDEFEFTRTTVAKSSSRRVEERSIEWNDRVSTLTLQEAPNVHESNFLLGIAENDELIRLEREFEERFEAQLFEDSENDQVDAERRSDGYMRAVGSLITSLEVQCVLLAIFAAFILPLVCGQTLQIQACCAGGFQSQCQNFSRAEDLFGVACCGFQPYNAFTRICCNGAVRDRKSLDGRYAELCCGTETLAYDQTCCDGVVHNVPGGDCCGAVVYSKTDPTLKCCNETLVRATSANDICCGGTTFDGGRTQMCCGDSVFQVSDFDSCCESPGGTFQQFNSATQFCCGTPQQRQGNMACCYLRQNGQLIQTAYDKTTQCCKYPFDIIQPMTNNSCV